MNHKLNSSVPANNWKVIELYNKIKKGELDPSPSFQRKLVWKKQHKYKFIDTVLLNFPFPEIYIAPGKLDTDSLQLVDLIVDGQQRCTTLVNYIEGKDVFALNNLPIKKFNELEKEEKADFLNFEVSIRYMKNASEEQIKEIFQRINSTEYSLNSTERINAKWGDSEFVLFGKQILEKKETLDFDVISYKLNDKNRGILNDFFVNEFKVFTENDLKRMLALQYILTLLATIIEGEYFRRNDRTQQYVEDYNEEFIDASNIEISLTESVSFLISLDVNQKSYWYNKANVFTLLAELHKFEVSRINKTLFETKILEFEADYKDYLGATDEDPFKDKIEGQSKYFEYSREGVNEVSAREHRGKIISRIIEECI